MKNHQATHQNTLICLLFNCTNWWLPTQHIQTARNATVIGRWHRVLFKQYKSVDSRKWALLLALSRTLCDLPMLIYLTVTRCCSFPSPSWRRLKITTLTGHKKQTIERRNHFASERHWSVGHFLYWSNWFVHLKRLALRQTQANHHAQKSSSVTIQPFIAPFTDNGRSSDLPGKEDQQQQQQQRQHQRHCTSSPAFIIIIIIVREFKRFRARKFWTNRKLDQIGRINWSATERQRAFYTFRVCVWASGSIQHQQSRQRWRRRQNQNN